MIAKIWKKVLFVILIVACLFNIVSKLVKRTSVIDEMKAFAQYQFQLDKEKSKQK